MREGESPPWMGGEDQDTTNSQAEAVGLSEHGYRFLRHDHNEHQKALRQDVAVAAALNRLKTGGP